MSPDQPGQWPPRPQDRDRQRGGRPSYPASGIDHRQLAYQARPPRRKTRRGLLVGLAAALVVVAGGAGTWVALSRSDSGAATPVEAALRLVGSISNGDVAGVLTSLAPAEAAVLVDPVTDVTNEFKRLKVLAPGFEPKTLAGVAARTENLTFDEGAAEHVNDHVTITKLTGGTVTVTTDLSKLPLTKGFLDQAAPAAVAGKADGTRSINIGDEVRKIGEPLRIATVKVDGRWYPSLFYTIADYALKSAGERWPSTSIPAVGAASSNDAVKEMVQAALDADMKRAIELVPPDEMAVLHDTGPAILKAVGSNARPTGVKVLDLQTRNSPVSGGTRATLTSLRLQDSSGRQFSVRKDGDCYDVDGNGQNQHLCADAAAAQIAGLSGTVPSAVTQVFQHFSAGIMRQGLGVITTESQGKYYVSPLRTLSEQALTLLRSIDPGDIAALSKLAN